MGPQKKSSAWNYFNKIDDKTAKCKICQRIIKTAGNTTNLMGHIRNLHKAVFIQISTEAKKSKAKSSTVSVCPQPQPTTSNPSPCTSKSLPDEAPVILSEVGEPMENPLLTKEVESDTEIPLKRQKPIISAFEEMYSFTPTGNKTKRINNSILYMICKDNQPFSIVDNEGFRHLLKVDAPQYKIPSRSSFIRWLDNKYYVLWKIFKDKLSSVEHITLTTDICSDSMQMRSFLGLTAHFGVVTELNSVTLGVYELSKRHTSEYLSEMLLNTCREWGINPETISAAFTQRKHISCFAHTLNLVA
ncbi:unnamed protein product [Psylliodes chrysocephalus]|uniref:BED-type domain-containing protein n=1 Tax=Psylliodes chrysocephalus TaxID=3402493 RepID=A0A9P0GDI2_9CUCU|nr:unnamed protein product [Psylliodes chrysocephala]